MVRALVKTSSEQGLTQVNLTYLTAVNGAPGAGQFRSSVSGRAPMIDLSNDLMPRMGVERIQTQQVMRVDGETGPSGEPVYKPVNDKFDQIRCAGNFVNLNAANGPAISGNSAGDFIEITFYGTGLNTMWTVSGVCDIRVSIDGAAEGSNIFPASLSTITGNRNYNVNQLLNVASGLSLGLHTVKIRFASNNPHFFGFEILNESTSIKTSAGISSVNGKQLSLASVNSQAYNSTFDSGTLGTRGGRVLVYQKTDGTIGKSVTPTNASQLNLSSADHTNEEVVRNYFWREFGAGRTANDDFSVAGASGIARAFTLDDGTTTLVANNAVSQPTNSLDSLGLSNNTNFYILTFVGTGVDIGVKAITSGGTQTTEYFIDGVTVGTDSTVQSSVERIQKIVSGLPYGTHTLKIVRNAATVNEPGFNRFIVYGPKKPTLPSGTIELADYNIVANYVANTVAGLETISTGTLRKSCSRELIYSGTWSALSTPDLVNYVGAFEANSNFNTGYMQYTFFGSGAELRFASGSNRSSNISVTLNGLAATVANFPSLTSSVYGLGVSFAAGILSQFHASGSGGAGCSISGLPLGTYTIRFTNNTGNYLIINTLDVITPIHVHKNNGPFVLQNTLSVGSSGINDGRTLSTPFNNSLIKNCGVAENGGGGGIYTAAKFPGSTSNTINIRPGKRLRVDIMIDFVPINANDSGGYGIYLDGVRVSYKETTLARAYLGGGTTGMQIAQSETFNVAPGIHHVYIKLVQGGSVSDEGHRIYVTETD